jgi:hypothetical protein
MEVIVCDGCSWDQYEQSVIETQINKTILIMDVINRCIRAFTRVVEVEPGYVLITATETTVPIEYQYTFSEYMQVYDLINAQQIKKTWNAIPIQLSIQGVYGAQAVVQGAITITVWAATSVHDALNNTAIAIEVGREVNKLYMTSFSMKFKVAVYKLITRRPFIVTVKFPDNTKVDYLLINPDFSAPWAIIPDTALDSNGQLITPPSNIVHEFNEGYGSGNYRAKRNYSGIRVKQSCRTAFTGSASKMVSQIICFWVAIP